MSGLHVTDLRQHYAMRSFQNLNPYLIGFDILKLFCRFGKLSILITLGTVELTKRILQQYWIQTEYIIDLELHVDYSHEFNYQLKAYKIPAICQFLPLFSQDLLLSGSVSFLLLSLFVIGFATKRYVVGFGCSPLKSQ